MEKEYPEIDLQVEMTTTATMNGDSERRLRKGHGTDLVVTTMPTGEVKGLRDGRKRGKNSRPVIREVLPAL